MSGTSSDLMLQRLEQDVEERNSFIEVTTANAQNEDRDLTENELEMIKNAQKAIESAEQRIDVLGGAVESGRRARKRQQEVQRAYSEMRQDVEVGEVEYRTAGQWARDRYFASINEGDVSQDARKRLEIATRAAAHIKTGDVAGIIPDPIVGELINFIDATRPIVSAVGTSPITSATWHRPVVSQHTAVALQGTAGEAADEKAELTSQKLTITDLDGSAKTLGGYVNVSRQTIDFGPGLDFVIDDLAAQYAILTEDMAAEALEATGTAAVGYGTAGSEDAESISNAVWSAVGTVFGVTQGRGRLVIAVAPDRLGIFGRLFAPVNPQSAQSPGFSAGNFSSGVMGTISGVPVVMSSQLTAGTAFVFSTAALELFERQIGNLSVQEPSVLGTQVAYAGYFEALTINDDAIVPLTATA